jgi:DNA-binding transcriptional regulator YdaS (Cro superfamily)
MNELQKWLDQNPTQAELAKKIGVTQGAISQWLKRGVPPKRVRAVERVTGIPRERLRPDIYGGAKRRPAQ